jgi:hypothetical protein
MARFGILLCALLLSGCNSILPGATAPEASAPPQAQVAPGAEDVTTGTIVPPPLADLDCAPRPGAITCN